MDNGEKTSGEHKMVVSGKELVNLNPGNKHANKNALHLERASALDISDEGYGRAARSGVSSRSSPYDRNEYGNESLADLLGSSLRYCQVKGSPVEKTNAEPFPVGMSKEEEKELSVSRYKGGLLDRPITKEKGYLETMLQIARNNKTEKQGDVEEILIKRGMIYDNILDPK